MRSKEHYEYLRKLLVDRMDRVNVDKKEVKMIADIIVDIAIIEAHIGVMRGQKDGNSSIVH